MAIDHLLVGHDGIITSVAPSGKFVLNFYPPDCLGIIYGAGRQQMMQGPERDMGDLSSLVLRQINVDNFDIVARQAKAALHTIPNPGLGALQGCVEGSLLARVCDRYVVRRVQGSLADHSAELKTSFAQNIARARKIACRAIKGVDPADRPPSYRTPSGR